MASLTALWATIQGELLFQYFSFVSRTSRSEVSGLQHLEEARQSERPLLFAFWHQQVMLVTHFTHAYLDPMMYMPVLVGDTRGIILDRVGKRIGVRQTARIDMQGNPVAAGRTVLRVIQAMKKGVGTMIAPDGPDGPAFVPKPGVTYLARKAQAAVVPFGAFGRPSRPLNRWDRFLVTVPFSRMYFAIGRPILVEQDVGEAPLSERIVEALHAVRLHAREMAGVR